MMNTSNTNLPHDFSSSASAALDATANAAQQAVNVLTDEAQGLAKRTSDLMSESAAQVRRQAELTRDATRGYIQDEPLKSVLIAAAAGAGLVLLGSLLTRNAR